MTKDTSDVVSLLNRWADVLEIPSGDFVNEDLRRAAALISSLVAERDNLEAWFDGLTPNEMHDSITRLKDRALTAERLLAEARAALEPFAELGRVILAEAPGEADIVLFTDCGGRVHTISLSDFRRASIGGGNG
jgi:hypothetical protein